MGDWSDEDPAVALHDESAPVSDCEALELELLAELVSDVTAVVLAWRAAMPPLSPRNTAALSTPAATRDLAAA